MKRNLKRFSKIAAILLVVFAVGFSFLLGDMSNVMAAEKIADLDTSAKYTESLGDNASTEYAGRVWTDKSVYSEKEITFTDSGVKVTNDSDFLVSFSALATSQEVNGKTSAPLDVVFIIDLSASMDEDMNNANGQNAGSRLKNTIAALNTSITNLMALNAYTRVAVVGYGSVATTLLPLGHYSKNGNTDWFTLNNNESAITITTSTYNSYLSKTSASQYGFSGNYYLGGETNIQAGVYTGMNILASLSSTDVNNDADIYANIAGNQVKRTPSVVILSDGAPSASSNSTSWWNPGNNDGNGDGQNFYYGNGLKAMMAATYMKAAIDRKYQLTDDAKTTIYTIGMGISQLSTSNSNNHGSAPRYLAQLTLNPKKFLDENNDNVLDNASYNDNIHESSMKTALRSYGNGNNVSVRVNGNNGSYTMRHPSSNDITVADVINYVDQHYDANSSDTVDSVFKDIVNDISLGAAEVPTLVSGSKDALTDGYITYTDPIGEYMEVKDLKGLIFRDTLYTAMGEPVVTQESTNTTKTTYTFTDKVTTYIHGEQNLSNIIIEVTSVSRSNGIKDETIVIKVPAALIPLRINTVSLNANGQVTSHTSNNALPIRLLYTVGLQEDVLDDYGHVTTKVSRDYISDHLNDDGTVDFYSNLFDGTNKTHIVHSDGSTNELTVGNTTVEFTPSTTNPFYYMQENTVIYQNYDENTGTLSNPVPYGTDLVDNKVYYYQGVQYYFASTIQTEIVQRTGAQLKQVSTTNHNGSLARAAGTAHVNRVLEFEGTKIANSTQTAEDFYLPTYVGNALTDLYSGSFKVYLGNNGVVSYNAPNRLVVSKNVAVEDGFDNSLHVNKEFDITIQLTNTNKDVNGEYYLAMNGSQYSETITFVDGKATITLKHGEYATIYGIPDGTRYEVSESVSEYEDTYEFSDVQQILGNASTGAEVDNVDITNTYKPTPLVYPTADTIGITKLLTGTDWIDAYNGEFSFVLSPYQNAPMPEGTDAVTGQKIVTLTNVDDHIADDQHTANIDFGQFTFTKPGTYYYSIVEREPEANDFLAGMTYSRAYYRLIITVTDDGNGNLSATHTIQMLLGQDGEVNYKTNPDGTPMTDANGLYIVEQNVTSAVFNNRYSADEIIVNPVALKTYNDHSGHNPISNMFSFTLTPVGYYDNNGNLVPDTSIPMHTNGLAEDTVSNISHNVTFNSIRYITDFLQSESDNKIVYRYMIKENVPAGAINNTLNGMTYDPTVWYMEVTLTDDNSVLKTSVAYYIGESTESVERIPTFVNEYNVKSTTAQLEVSKVLNGRNWQDGDSFTFTLEAYDDVTKNAITNSNVVLDDTTLTIDSDVAEKFEAIEFKQIGTYKFAIKETKGTIAGINYDNHTEVVTVTVTDVNGELVASVDYENASNAVFTNTYTTTTSAPIHLNGLKVLEGRPLRINDFSFVITPVNNAPLGEGDGRSVNAEDGTVVLLNNIRYDAVGTYEYIISEYVPTDVEGHRPGITNDLSQYKVTVTVTDIKDGLQVGQLTAEITSIQKIIDHDGTAINPKVELLGTDKIDELIVFNNTYVPDNAIYTPIVLDKTITGDKALNAGDYQFELSLVSGDETGIIFTDDSDNDHIVVVENDANGEIIFGNITFTKVGTYKVKVREIIPTNAVDNVLNGITYDDHEIFTTFVVTDDLNGKLVVTRETSVGDIIFINDYKTTGQLTGLEVVKDYRDNANELQWTKDLFKDHVFKFMLEIRDTDTLAAKENGSIVLPDNANGVTVTASSEGYAESFGNITFNKAGTYEFVVREDTSNPYVGVNYDDMARIVVVTVVDDGNGHLTATSKIYKDTDKNLGYSVGDVEVSTLEFKNVYKPGETVLYGHDNLDVTKNFTGRVDDQWLDTDEFKFTLEADLADPATKEAIDENNIVLGNTTLTINKVNKDHAHFGDITFKTSGTFKFIVKEDISNPKPYITYDQDEKVVIVNVVDQNGVLVVALADNSEDLVFNNTYNHDTVKLSTSTNLVVTKQFDGRNWNDTDVFKFKLTPNETYADVVLGVAEIEIKKTTSNYETAFGDIEFKEPGSYSFTITEDKSNPISGVTYADKVVTVNVVVADDNEGKLYIADVQYETANSYGDEEALTFVNTYNPGTIQATISGKKTISGRGLINQEFEFILTAVNNAPMPNNAVNGELTVKNSDDNINFGSIVYDKAGTYHYTIEEVQGNKLGVTYDSKIVNVEVEVTYDANKGTLNAEVTYDGNASTFEFTNKYVPNKVILSGNIDLLVTKQFTGRDGNEWLDTDVFEFTIHPYGQTTIDAVNTKDVEMTVGQRISIDKDSEHYQAYFNDITFNKVGTYQFTISEINGGIGGITYSNKSQVITVTVTDEGQDGQLDIAATGNEVDDLTFVNTYTTTETTLSGSTYLKVTKDLQGRDWFNEDTFEFKLEPVENYGDKVVMGTTTVTVTKDEQTKAFGDITFKEVGTYKFKITEVKGNIGNIAYSEQETIVTVVVSDNNKGSLECATPTTVGSMTFVNTYTPNVVTATLTGNKLISGRDFITTTDIFEFTLTPITQGAPVPNDTKVNNDGNGNIQFAPISFNKAGTYVYEITETGGSVAGITNDSGKVTATVKVEYDSTKGTFNTPVITYVKTGGPNDGNAEFKFVNTYTTTSTDPITSINATKVVKVSEGNTYTIKDGTFKFKIAPVSTNPTNDPISTNEQLTNVGNVVEIIGNNVVYSQPGTYVYEVTEVSDGLNLTGMSYDDSVYVITVVVVDNQATAKLEASMSIEKRKPGENTGTPVNEITFNNGYNPLETTASFTGTKKLTGSKPLQTNEFTFRLTALTQGAPMPQVNEVKNTTAATDNINFGNITYTKPGTYEYVITEVADGKAGYTYSDKEFKVTVVVTDVNGQLTADTIYSENVVFTNDYTPKSVILTAETAIVGNKVLEGRPLVAGEFEFELLDKNSKVAASGKNDANGKVVFSELEFTETGTFYYTMVEKRNGIAGITYDEKTYTVEIVVTDEKYDGQLDATVTYKGQQGVVDSVTFKNTYKAKPTSVQLGVTKVLDGRDLIADEFTFELKNDEGKVVSQAKNSVDGVVLFDEIEYTQAGTYTYTISEVEGTLDYVNYDKNVYNVTVEVTDDLNGNLVAVVKEGIDVVFNNIYTFNPQLSIIKGQSVNGNTVDYQQVKSGDKVVYTLTVANTGVGTAEDVVITDKIPEGLVLVDGSISHNGTYDATTGTITWLVDVTDTEEVSLTFEVLVPKVTKDTTWKNIATYTYNDITEESNEVTIYEEYVVDTNDHNDMMLWAATMILSLGGIIVLSRRREEF